MEISNYLKFAATSGPGAGGCSPRSGATSRLFDKLLDTCHAVCRRICQWPPGSGPPRSAGAGRASPRRRGGLLRLRGLRRNRDAIAGATRAEHLARRAFRACAHAQRPASLRGGCARGRAADINRLSGAPCARAGGRRASSARSPADYVRIVVVSTGGRGARSAGAGGRVRGRRRPRRRQSEAGLRAGRRRSERRTHPRRRGECTRGAPARRRRAGRRCARPHYVAGPTPERAYVGNQKKRQCP